MTSCSFSKLIQGHFVFIHRLSFIFDTLLKSVYLHENSAGDLSVLFRGDLKKVTDNLLFNSIPNRYNKFIRYFLILNTKQLSS